MMWTPVVQSSEDNQTPSARAKHSATLVGSYVYLIGGRNGNLPLKDMWKYDLANGKWTQLKPNGDRLPCLQEHTVVSYKDSLYVFGGEVGFSSGTETPLWRYDINTNFWKKIKAPKDTAAPCGRRGHTALIYRGNMLIYGGYQDLRGSSTELWAFHFDTEKWVLLSSNHSPNKLSFSFSHSNELIPPGRHKHSAIIHDDCMWIYGGMTDLQERSDLWKWDTVTKTWSTFKFKHGPGTLHSHAACKLPGCMIIFGGETNGHPTNELWKFNFAMENWEKIQIQGLKPQPRAETIAFTVSELLLKPKSEITSVVRLRCRTSLSADRMAARHSSYNPSIKVTPTEQTFVFQPTNSNYTDGSDESFHKSLLSNSNLTYKSAQPGSFLREIQKLSQLNLSKFGQGKNGYSALNNVSNVSTESLIKNSFDNQDENATPFRNSMVKSQSAHIINKKRSSLISPLNETSLNKISEFETRKFHNFETIKREPISVPNFSTLILPTPTLTTAEAARLVFVDTESDDDDHINRLPSDKTSNKKEDNETNDKTSKINFADTDTDEDIFSIENCNDVNKKEIVKLKPPLREDSYTSHLNAPIYDHVPKSTSVKFKDLQEVSDESTTSDYASVEGYYKVSYRKNGDQEKLIKSPTESTYGFSNPNYLGPEMHELEKSSNADKQSYAKSLNTPDSGVGDLSGRCNDMLELKELDENNKLKRVQPPNSLALNCITPAKTLRMRLDRFDKVRASSASRVEKDKRIKINEYPNKTDPLVPLYIFIIGGKEHGQITVFKRPISVWRLKLY